MQIILASQAQARRKALDILGLQYEVILSELDEKAIRDSDPKQMAKKLAEAKAMEIAARTKGQSAVIVAADLFVTLNGKIYEKPKDVNEAKEMLRDFSGKSQTIISGLAVYNTKTKKILSSVETCTVEFRELTEGEIQDYISKYPVTRFAGACEGDGVIRFAEQLNGNYNFQTGLPMNKLILFLRENKINV